MNRPVLIVDDDSAVRGVVLGVLRKSGHPAHAAESGEECLAMVREGFRGVILMDVILGGLDGWDTVRVLADEALTLGNAICMLTGVGQPPEKAAGLEEHVLDYLTKPFTPQDLVRRVGMAEACLDGV